MLDFCVYVEEARAGRSTKPIQPERGQVWTATKRMSTTPQGALSAPMQALYLTPQATIDRQQDTRT